MNACRRGSKAAVKAIELLKCNCDFTQLLCQPCLDDLSNSDIYIIDLMDVDSIDSIKEGDDDSKSATAITNIDAEAIAHHDHVEY